MINFLLEDSYSSKDTFYMKMYITMEPLYNEVSLDLTNYLFLNSSNSKIYVNLIKNLDVS